MAPKPGSDRDYRCKVCIRLDIPKTHLWTCRECGRRLCQHGMNQGYRRVDGTGYCRSCAWRRSRPEAANARLARMGLSPLASAEPAGPEPEPFEVPENTVAEEV